MNPDAQFDIAYEDGEVIWRWWEDGEVYEYTVDIDGVRDLRAQLDEVLWEHERMSQ